MMRMTLAGLGLGLGMLCGCSETEPPALAVSSGVAPTQQHQVVILHPDLKKLLYISQADANYTPDGRMVVRANIQNNSDGELELQIRTTFKDAAGMSTGDQTPFKRLTLTRGTIETYTETSMNNKARDFAIEIRTPNM